VLRLIIDVCGVTAIAIVVTMIVLFFVMRHRLRRYFDIAKTQTIYTVKGQQIPVITTTLQWRFQFRVRSPMVIFKSRQFGGRIYEGESLLDAGIMSYKPVISKPSSLE